VVAARGAVAQPVRTFAGISTFTEAQLRNAPVRWPRPSTLELPLATLAGVGPRLAEAAAGVGLHTVGDLLLRFPRGHRNRTLKRIDETEIDEQATIRVEVLSANPRRVRRGNLRIVTVKVGDDSGFLKATWFNQPWMAEKLTQGMILVLTGMRDKYGLQVSEYQLVASDSTAPSSEEGAEFIPVHRGTEELKPQQIRRWVGEARGWARNSIEALPAELRARLPLAQVGDAIQAFHLPDNEIDIKEAQERLVFEELFLYQAILGMRKRVHRVARPAPKCGQPGELVRRWIASLPFELTQDQQRALEEVDVDLDSGQPMQRLLMGEVGSGKTVVALYSMLRALEAGYQAALMAPTETLAEQHAATLGKLLAQDAIPFALLTGATPARQRRESLARLLSGELGLVVGTHALIQPTVNFARMGLCVVDEQHRFGVSQRKALDSKGPEGMAPHVLHMTATPIPRTLSLTAYGDLDMTALHELPSGRKPVTTELVTEGERAGAYELLREQLRAGRQAFVVCPLVSESEKVSGKAAEAEAARLEMEELHEFRLRALHGQMPPAQKAAAMAAFAAGEVDVLVATTVIEVGIDMPNASVMIIEGAERYGVSQLHQLRGRVGRGEHESYCLLFFEGSGALARQRLEAIAAEQDGFKLAEADLSLRGEGEVLGTRQSGLPRFGVAELPEDADVLVAARNEVQNLLNRYDSLEVPELGPLMDAARWRFGAGATDPIPL
jgi:ATP-dependent DNA helicase RecG